MRFESTIIPIQSPVGSLLWQGDSLVDLTQRGETYLLDGSHLRSNRYWAYKFDAAVISPSGRFAVVYERLGTKALLLEGLEIVREINRSYYHAQVYEYPIAFATAPDGRELIIHCPDEYCRLDIEVAATGERLTNHPERKSQDVFYSQLSVSPDGRWLSSAGWVWHPWGVVSVFDLNECLADPRLLDSNHWTKKIEIAGEANAAVFRTDSTLLISSTLDDDAQSISATHNAAKEEIAVWSLTEGICVIKTDFAANVGVMMPVGTDHVIAFYDHPKLVSLQTGEIVQEWTDIDSAKQGSCIIHHLGDLPPIAMDPAHQRFAVAGKDKIQVIQLLES